MEREQRNLWKVVRRRGVKMKENDGGSGSN
jgi:hypothetical protein